MIDLDNLRRTEFPWTATENVAYLNHAGTGPLPERTVRALHEWRTISNDVSLIQFPIRGNVCKHRMLS